MEVIVVLLAAGVFFLPLILSLVALGKISSLRYELEELRKKITPPAPAQAPRPVIVSAPPPVVAPVPPPPPLAPSAPPPAVSKPAPRPEALSDNRLEVALGGKIASFVGMATLLIGIVFFVGYAIQHQWIGPGARIVLGLLAGAGLVVLGHVAEIRSVNLRLLARVLTGGGAALFYFSVFAAYGIYHLIGPTLAGAGLVASAAAVFALAVLYDSQVIAVIGLLGAFLMPPLISHETKNGLFALSFIAAVNAPVLALGFKRRWQTLYNLAFALTVAFAAFWMANGGEGLGKDNWCARLLFALLFFGEFVALGLVKLAREPATGGRSLDVLRLGLSSLALVGAVYGILEDAGLDTWAGAAFVAGAVLHLVLAMVAWRWWAKYTNEILVLLLGGVTFAALALPVQLDGVWVSLGWAIEGVVLAWFGRRVQSSALQAVAALLGFVGLFKSLTFDVQFYLKPPRLFLNGRFVTGLLSAIGLGVQSLWVLPGRADAKGQEDRETVGVWFAGAAVLAAVAVIFADAFFTLPHGDPWAGVLTTAALLVAGLFIQGMAGRYWPATLGVLGTVLLFLAPLKLVLFDLGWGWSLYGRQGACFVNTVFGVELAMLALIGWMANPLPGGPVLSRASGLRALALLAGIVVVTAEIARWHDQWNSPLITLWWAVCALGLALTGLVRRRTYLRYLALLIFGATVAKVFLVDLADLRGLQRVAALMGAGLLLLILSFAYQRVAPLLLGRETPAAKDGEK